MRHLPSYIFIPPKENTEFIACMEEKPYQLIGEGRDPLPMRTAVTTKQDFYRLPGHFIITDKSMIAIILSIARNWLKVPSFIRLKNLDTVGRDAESLVLKAFLKSFSMPSLPTNSLIRNKAYCFSGLRCL